MVKRAVKRTAAEGPAVGSKKKRRMEAKLEKVASDNISNSEVNGRLSAQVPEAPVKNVTAKWRNKQRCLVFSSRGISHRHRHLMTDIKTMLPHSKSESKMDKKDEKRIINEICEMRNCTHCLYFEPRREQLYLWMANVPEGPTAHFLVENVHTMLELKMTGNCLKGSRPLLVFDSSFTTAPHLQLLKELFTQVFGTPYMHPRSQPFTDRVLSLTWLDGRVWLRNYQVVEETGALAEIGPRATLNPITLFSGSFQSTLLWKNPQYVSPASRRRILKMSQAHKYNDRKQQQKDYRDRRPGRDTTVSVDVTDDVFVTSVGDESDSGVDLKQQAAV